MQLKYKTIDLPLDDKELKDSLRKLTLKSNGMMEHFLKANKPGKATLVYRVDAVKPYVIGWACCINTRGSYGWSGKQCLGVFVHPKYRGFGIAKKLVSKVIKSCKYNTFYVDMFRFKAYTALLTKKFPKAVLK